MKQRAALLAAILAWVTAPVAIAEESGANEPAKSASHGEEKTAAPAGEHKLDFKELFGCEPMGEGGHMATHRSAPEAAQQDAVQPAQERGQIQERR